MAAIKVPPKPRHGWLRDALTDKGHTQHDVAVQWGVDDAVVSRFIRTGEPELTFDRAQVLTQMLSISLDELRLRLREGIPMRSPVPAREPETASDQVLAELREAVQKARAALPNAKIEVTVSHREEKL